MRTNLKKGGTIALLKCALSITTDYMSSIPLRVAVYQGMPHAFWIFPELTTSKTATQDMINGARWLSSEARST